MRKLIAAAYGKVRMCVWVLSPLKESLNFKEPPQLKSCAKRKMEILNEELTDNKLFQKLPAS